MRNAKLCLFLIFQENWYFYIHRNHARINRGRSANIYSRYLSIVSSNNMMVLYNIISHDDVIKWKHFTRYWPFVQGIHRSPVNSPHKGQWRGALMFFFICAWINSWVNNSETGDLRRYRAHYEVTVMNEMFWIWVGFLDKVLVISGTLEMFAKGPPVHVNKDFITIRGYSYSVVYSKICVKQTPFIKPLRNALHWYTFINASFWGGSNMAHGGWKCM